MVQKLARFAPVMVLMALLLALAPAAMAAPPLQSVGCAEEYTVQAGDWLSTIAEKYYGDALAYTVIVNATNAAAAADDKYEPVTDPSVIEVSQVLCIPADDEAEALLNGQIAVPAPDPAMPEDKLLAIIGNRSFEDISSTLKITGGEFGEDGQEFEIAAGEEIRLEIEPGEYNASWGSPEGVTFSRDFLARAGVVAINWMVPEESYVFSEIQRSAIQEATSTEQADSLGQITTPSVTHTETPYYAPEGKALLVAGNRSFAFLPSTLTITGGQFGEGKEFMINPGQELLVALDPVEYTVSWTSPPANEEAVGFDRTGKLYPVAGDVTVVWIVPEDNRAFMQSPGEEGQAME